MKIYSISDLHLCHDGTKPMEIFGGNWENYWEKIKSSWNNTVTDEDIVLICGDISGAMKLEEAIPDLNEIGMLKGIKLMIRGNHDYWWQSLTNIRKILPEKMYVLQNDAIKFNDCIFCGSRGWTVPEDDFKTEQDKKIFEREMIRLELALKSAKDLYKEGDKIYVMIHYPPFNSFYQKGYSDLFEKYGVYACIYGHLHGDKCKAEKIIEKNGVKYYLTSCDQVDNTLVEIK